MGGASAHLAEACGLETTPGRSQDLKCACAQLALAGEGAAASLPGLGGVYNPEASWRLSSWSDLRPFGSWGK